MKNLFCKFFFPSILFFAVENVSGQCTGINYTFSQPAGAMNFNNSTAGSVSLISGGTDEQLVSFPAPATWGGFYYGGIWYPQGSTTFYVSSNGWLSIQKTGDPIPVGALPGNNLSLNPRTIAPLWDDLKVHVNGEVTYKIIGGATARALVIEWRGMYWDHNATDTAISFQAILHDNEQGIVANRNTIDFRYKRNGSGTAFINNASGGASIGISGFCGSDVFAFASVAGQPTKTSPEISNLSSKPADAATYRFTPIVHPNDECSNAETITFNPTLPLISSLGTTLHSTQSSAALPTCGAPATVSDVWYTFTKPANITNFEIFTDSLDCRGANFKTGLEIYNSCGSSALLCDFGSAGPAGTNASSYLNLTNQACTAQQYWVRVYSADTSYRGYFRFNIRPPGRNCAYANDFTGCGVPYSSPLGLSTCGFGNEYDSTNSEPHTPYNSGEDYVFSYISSATICVNFSLSNTAVDLNPGLFIYQGCPDFGTCIGYAKGSGGSSLNFNNVSLVAGLTYYFVVDNDTTGYLNCLYNFDFSVTLSTATPSANDICASANNVPVVTSTACTGVIDYNNNCTSPTTAGTLPLPSCGNFTDGVTPDVWFTFTSTSISVHQIKIDLGTAPSAQDLAMAVYTGTCGAMTLVNCDDNSNGSMPSLAIVPPSAGTTYYVRVWSNNGTQTGNFRICVVNGCSATNDFCTGAIPLTIGQYTQGDNSCASGINEPLADTNATCWTNSGGAAQLNTVWYSFIATDDTMKIRTHLLTLFDSQIALYSSTGGCGGTFTQLSCNDNTLSPCYMSTDKLSQITATGLTVGSTYFIRVDGVNANTGTFEIIVAPGLYIFPPILGQDCPLAIPLCNDSTITVAPNGYQGEGNTCDVAPGATCLINGEANSVFYKFSVTGTGFGNYVQFTITPNGIGNCDFMIWCIDTVYGAGDQIPAVPNYCYQLSNFLIFPSSVCDFSAARITGCNSSGGTINIPGLYSGSLGAPAFAPAIYVPTGMTATFLLLVNSDSNANGFTLDWMGTPINGIPPTLVWSNANNSNWNDSSNWSSTGCGVAVGNVPDCNNQTLAIIMSGGIMPVFSVNTTVPDITISSGASITINPGVTLEVCGNLVNNGTIISGAGSTVKFIGPRNASISGYFTSSNNNFYRLEVAKDSGAVLSLGTNVYIIENDSIYSGILNNNNMTTEVGGNFYNYNGNVSCIGHGAGAGGSRLRFTARSGAQQHFRNDGSSLVMNNVEMNQTIAGALILDTNSTSNLRLGIGGGLAMISGKIIADTLHEVNITNTNPFACSVGNTTSYVEGNLRRAIGNTTGTYEFPVGDSTKGYQRFSIQYLDTPSVPYNVVGKFNPWVGMPSAGPSISECTNIGWDIFPPFDNGYWTMDASDTTGLGTYSAIAYPRNITNNVGATFSVMKSVSNNGQGPWLMEGVPFCWSTATWVERDSLNSFSDFAVVQSGPMDYVTSPRENEFAFSLFPNPTSEKTTLTFISDVPQKFLVSLKDVTGRIILKQNIIAVEGMNSCNINLHDVAKGIYLLVLENEKVKAAGRVVVE